MIDKLNESLFPSNVNILQNVPHRVGKTTEAYSREVYFFNISITAAKPSQIVTDSTKPPPKIILIRGLHIYNTR